MPHIDSHGVSDAGLQRPLNEDRILVEPTLGAFGVFDGIGGQRRGEVAADIAMASVKRYLETSVDPMDVTWPYGYNFNFSLGSNRVITAVRLANRQVWRRAEESLECSGMGTTIAVVLVSGSTATIANAGDSRIYRFRNGELAQLSVDDTMAGAMLKQNLVSPELIRKHPLRNMLTQAAGQKEELDVHLVEEELSAGDILLLTSDGLHGVVEDKAIAEILGSGISVQAMAETLLKAALDAGAPDNVSIVGLSVG